MLNHFRAARAAGLRPYVKEAFWTSGYWKRPLLLGTMAIAGVVAYRYVIYPVSEVGGLDWRMEKVAPARTGIQPKWGRVYERLDPRVQNIAKWLFSVGDAVAVGDFDGDGLPDLFFTLPLRE